MNNMTDFRNIFTSFSHLEKVFLHRNYHTTFKKTESDEKEFIISWNNWVMLIV